MVKPVLSFLLPSRSRFDKVIGLIEEVLDQVGAGASNEIEFVIKFDSDDLDSINRIKELPTSKLSITTIVADRLQGYRDLYIFYNACARLSRGTFMLMWNDDARFVTRDWYAKLKAAAARDNAAMAYWFGGTPSLVQLPDGTSRTEDWPAFIAQHRLLYEVMGTYSDIGGVDAFLYYVLGPLGLLRKLEEIQVSHQAWFQIPIEERDTTSHLNSLPGAMVPTNHQVVAMCQERIKRFAQQQQMKAQQAQR